MNALHEHTEREIYLFFMFDGPLTIEAGRDLQLMGTR